MNETSVPLRAADEPALATLAAGFEHMSPQLRKAAQYVLDNPREVGLCSIREIAAGAGVKPNTLVRMARALGYEGYEDFRRPFRESLRAGRESFPDRARWLQSLGQGGRHARLFAQMATSTIENVEALYAEVSGGEVKEAADLIVGARTTWVLGVGVAHALAQNFAYLARMALDSVVAVPRGGSLPIDDIARAGAGDVLLAMTFAPYRTEVVEAVRVAREQGVDVIALSDARSSPICIGARHAFVLPVDTPQFFTSMVAAGALLETLMAFVVADAAPQVVERIERFHRRRHELGVYWRDGG